MKALDSRVKQAMWNKQTSVNSQLGRKELDNDTVEMMVVEHEE